MHIVQLALMLQLRYPCLVESYPFVFAVMILMVS